MATRLLLEGGDLQALLARVRAEHGPDARIVSADRLRRGGVAGFFSRQWFEIGVELPDDPPTAPPPEGPSDTFAALLADAAPADPPDAPPAAPSDAFAALLADADRADSTGGTLLGDHPPTTPPAPAVVPAVAARTVPVAARTVPDTVADTVPGVVAAVAARKVPGPVTDGGMPARLVPLPGLVVVVAGELAKSMEVASWVATRLRIAPERTMVAGPAVSVPHGMRLCGPEHAAAVATDLHRGDTPVVVAVESRVDDPEGGRWAGAVVAALRADVLVATVDATRKTADLRRHLTDLGPVDALAVQGSSASADPSTVLELGLPVMLVDGRPGGLATD